MEKKLLYTTVESVKVRLGNKVQFQSQDPPLQGEIPNDFLIQMIMDGETAVEQALRGRYLVPFQSSLTKRYCDLPDHTMRVIRMLCDFKAVLIVLETDFGLGTHISSDPYAKNITKLYKENLTTAMGRDMEAASDKRDRYRFTPPLEGLALAVSNSAADNGFKGKLINTDATTLDPATYAEDHINDPSKSYIRRPGWGQW